MPRPPPAIRRFFGPPTLGGWLTIANCLGWAALGAGIVFTRPAGPQGLLGDAIIATGLVLSAPLALFCWLPRLGGGPSIVKIIASALMTGVNAIVWGYSAVWLARKLIDRCRALA